jgi:hypothetical protein
MLLGEPNPRLAAPGGTKMHVVVMRARPGPHDQMHVTAEGACGTELHTMGIQVLARKVAVEDRCRSAACRSRWPAWLRLVS